MTDSPNSDRIIRTIEIAAPVERVWDAIADHEKFGAWFRVALDQPFTVGGESTGHMTYPGYEHFQWLAWVVAIEPMTRFAYEWPANGGDTSELDNLASLPRTLCEFLLEPSGDGTKLTVIESGFDALDPERAQRVMRDNSGGWTEQANNIKSFVENGG